MQLMNDTDSALNSDYSPRGSIDYGTVSPTTESPPPIISYGVAVLMGVLEILIAMGAVIGNILVVASVYTNRKLRTITNLFVVSLAFSDLMVGLLVLPFSIKIQVTNRWDLGGVVCEIWTTLDVLLCTASILNLCCISLDRYFAITRPLACATKRSKRLALLMIAAVWVLSLIITIPPLLGWKDEDRLKNGKGSRDCDLIQEQNYVIYSALGSFYIPLAIMLFVYANIFVVARNAQIRWRHSSSKGTSMRSTSRPGSSPSSPVTTLSRRGDDEKRGVVSPKAMRVTSTESDAVCCGCFGRGEWSGTYSLTVADDLSLSPGVAAESYKREAAAGFELGRRSILINGTRTCSVDRYQRSCSLERDGGRCRTEEDCGVALYPARPYSQLYEFESNSKVTSGPRTRQSSSESEVRLSVGGPEAGPSSTWSDPQPPCVPGSTAPPGCTRPDAPSKKGSDVVREGPSSSTTQRSSSTTSVSWKRRRHSSFDCVLHKTRPRLTTIATESMKHHSSEYHGQQQLLFSRDLTIRYSDSLPTRLMRDRTVSITTTTSTTTPSTGSRASTGSRSSGASAEGNNCIPTEARYPSDIHSANTERALNMRRCDKRVTPHGIKTSFKTTFESAMTVPTVNSELNHSPSEAPTRGPDSGLFESPRRRVATSDFNASFRSVRRPTRSPNPTTDHVSRSYGSFADVTMTSTMARQMSRLSQKTVRDRRRENSVIFRESKTVKTVSIVIGCFVLCWLPFFVVYISEPFFDTPFDTNPYLKQFVTWLGYFNSVINPFIYAFYNYEFRSTFWQLTIGRLWKRSRRLPRGVAPSSPLNNVLRLQKSIRSNSVIVLSKLSAN